MKVFYMIVEIITSPFTFLFRTKATKNDSKTVNPLLVLLIALIITGALLLLYYYERLFK